MNVQRRSLLLGLASSLAAPAVVHAANLMPISLVPSLEDAKLAQLGYSLRQYLLSLERFTAADMPHLAHLANAVFPESVRFSHTLGSIETSEFTKLPESAARLKASDDSMSRRVVDEIFQSLSAKSRNCPLDVVTCGYLNGRERQVNEIVTFYRRFQHVPIVWAHTDEGYSYAWTRRDRPAVGAEQRA
jgi:hypothetical protein